MDDDGESIASALAAQDSIVRDLVREDVEHGVLIPLKTTLELRDDYSTGRVLITRTPLKSANPAITSVRPRLPALVSVAHVVAACCAVCFQMKSLRVSLIYADAQSRRICLLT
jgi:tRNA-specific adenosine deaminase 3